jgi:hypothetical protein
MSKLMKIRPVRAELLHAHRRTAGETEGQRDMTKLIMTFRNFAYSPKKSPRFFPVELQYFIVEKCGIYFTHYTSDIRSFNEDYFPISVNATFYSGFYKFSYQ